MTTDIERGPEMRAVEVELEIAAPADAVWAALTNPRELARWFPLQARVNPGVGGSIWHSWGGDEWEERIRIWEPNRRLGTVRAKDTWSDALHEKHGDASAGEDAAMVSLTMDFHLQGRGGSTILRLVHAGFGHGTAWDEEYDGVRRGWAYELRSLRHYLERHRGEDRQVAWVRWRTDSTPAEGWRGLFAGGALEVTPEAARLREGDAYEMRWGRGDVVHGVVVQIEEPTDYAVTVASWNDALLRIKLAEYAGEREVSFWLAGYGLSHTQLYAFEDRAAELVGARLPGAERLATVS